MAIDSINAKTNPATANFANPTTTATNSGANTIAKTQSDFFKLLTTQLKNQDPTKPTDNAQFTQQLIGFSGVEQQLNTNNKLDALVKSQVSTAVAAQLSSGVNYIGKMVEVENANFKLGATAEPKFAYDVPKGTVNSVITIANDKGQVVGTYKGSTVEGKQNLIWDGKDANGARLPAGKYAFSVAVTDTTGTASSAKTYSFGEVTSVETVKGATNVVVDGEFVTPIDKVTAVEQKQTAPAA